MIALSSKFGRLVSFWAGLQPMCDRPSPLWFTGRKDDAPQAGVIGRITTAGLLPDYGRRRAISVQTMRAARRAR